MPVLFHSLLPYLVFIVVAYLADGILADAQSDSFTVQSQFQKIMLDVHNQYRAEHNASALKWNDTLADSAQSVSKKCVFKHSGGPDGENLVAGYPNATSSADAWGEEEKSYDFGNPGFSEETGHFTQMVWKGTTTVGCAAVDCDGLLQDGIESWFVTCEYWPPGNVERQYQQNVLKQSSGSSDSLSSRQLVPVRSVVFGAVAVLLLGPAFLG